MWSKGRLPPSSVITIAVALGPKPSGLKTCNEIIYWVKVCSPWSRWLFLFVSWERERQEEFVNKQVVERSFLSFLYIYVCIIQSALADSVILQGACHYAPLWEANNPLILLLPRYWGLWGKSLEPIQIRHHRILACRLIGILETLHECSIEAVVSM